MGCRRSTATTTCSRPWRVNWCRTRESENPPTTSGAGSAHSYPLPDSKKRCTSFRLSAKGAVPTSQRSQCRRAQTTQQLPCVPSQEATLINQLTSRCSCPCSRGSPPSPISFFTFHETQNHDNCRSLQECAQST